MPRTPAEFLERASASSLSKDPAALKSPADDVYGQVKSPAGPVELENGALRAGPAPVIWSKGYMAFLMMYVGSGLTYSVFYGLVYPFLNNYLRMSGIATSSTYVLLTMPYTLKVFFGIIIDCVPIRGCRRRPYMLIGWTICTICCVIMACLPVGDPYYAEYDWVYLSEDELTADQIAQINYDAPDSGAKWVILMFIANVGVVIAATAVGGLMVEISQREPENVRGTLQTLIWVARDVGGVMASSFLGFGMNSEDFGGHFAGAIGVTALMVILAVVSLITGLGAWFFIEEQPAERRSIRVEVAKLFDLIQMRVVYQILIFLFFKNMFTNVSVTAASPIASVWAQVEPITSSVVSIIHYIVGIVTFSAVAKFGLNWSWRSMIVTSQIAIIVIDMIPTFLTIWDVVRNQWFWLGLPILDDIPSNIAFIVSTYCMVEIMEEGNEAAFYGLTVAISTLASPFATVLTKNIDANFDIATKDLQVDDNHVRWQVTYAYIISFAFKAFAIVFIVLLPRQKAECQELRRNGGKSKTIGTIVVLVLAFLYVWSIMTNIMSIFPSTSCLKVAGGKGC